MNGELQSHDISICSIEFSEGLKAFFFVNKTCYAQLVDGQTIASTVDNI